MAERRHAHDTSGGFSLLELLIVLAILSLILVALTSGVRFASRAWEIQERRSARQGDLDAVQNALRQLIAPARALEGDSGSLRFAGALPAALERGGLYDIELRVSEGRLLLAWKPHFKGPAPAIAPTPIELVRGVTGFEFAYYTRPGGWQKILKAGTVAPSLVRINLQLGEGRAWPPLVVAPMIEASSRNENR
jgi:general secretion pathway protein J